MISIFILIVSTLMTWLGLIYFLKHIFAGRLRHPHRRTRALTPVTDVSYRLSPKLFLPLLPFAAGLYVLAILPSLYTAAEAKFDHEQLTSLSLFLISVVVSYFYLVRNLRGTGL